jgi:hypothetical protein
MKIKLIHCFIRHHAFNVLRNRDRDYSFNYMLKLIMENQNET